VGLIRSNKIIKKALRNTLPFLPGRSAFLCLSFFTISFLPPNHTVAADRKLQTIEEINADLKRQKTVLEPFDPSQVKVDLESLGLDNVSSPKVTKEIAKDLNKKTKDIAKKAEEKTDETIKKSETELKEVSKELLNPEAKTGVSEKISAEISAPEIVKKTEQTLTEDTSNNPAKNSPEVITTEEEKPGIFTKITENLTKITDKITDKIGNKVDETNDAEVSTQKSPTQKYLSKKAKLRARLAKEQAEKRKKHLVQLRKQYLIDDVDEYESPIKKDLNRFVKEDLPPPPIMSRVRASDNSHIPFVWIPEECVESMFRSVAYNTDVSLFNASYRHVQNPNAHDSQGNTILSHAILSQNHAVVASLLAKGADPNMLNGLGYTPLYLAIEMLDMNSTELLIDHGADINHTDSFGRTYLIQAARLGFLPAVQLLVEKGVDIDALDSEGMSALATAYSNGKGLVVRYLQKNNAKVWAPKTFNPAQQSLIKQLEGRWR
jgi:hypothetical protein